MFGEKKIAGHELSLNEDTSMLAALNGQCSAYCACGKWHAHIAADMVVREWRKIYWGAGEGLIEEFEQSGRPHPSMPEVAAVLHSLHIRNYFRNEVRGWDSLVLRLEEHRRMNARCADWVRQLLNRLDRHSEANRRHFLEVVEEHIRQQQCHYNGLLDPLHSIGVARDIRYVEGSVTSAPFINKPWGIEDLAREDDILAEILSMTIVDVLQELRRLVGGPKDAANILGLDKAIRFTRWASGEVRPRPYEQQRARLYLRIARLVGDPEQPEVALNWFLSPSGFLGEEAPTHFLETYQWSGGGKNSMQIVLAAARSFSAARERAKSADASVAQEPSC